jgi:hypothetical protein
MDTSKAARTIVSNDTMTLQVQCRTGSKHRTLPLVVGRSYVWAPFPEIPEHWHAVHDT